MQFKEPKVEFIQFDSEVVTETSTNQCGDSYTGGTFTCTGANMTDYCGDKAAATR